MVNRLESHTRQHAVDRRQFLKVTLISDVILRICIPRRWRAFDLRREQLSSSGLRIVPFRSPSETR